MRSERRQKSGSDFARPAEARADFELVGKIGRTFAGVEESTCFGQPALKIGGKMFACLPSHRSAEPRSLVVRVDFARREELLAEAPDIYYLKDHYAGYNAVLVRLDEIQADALHGLLAGALQFVQAEKTKRRPRKGPRRQADRVSGRGPGAADP